MARVRHTYSHWWRSPTHAIFTRSRSWFRKASGSKLSSLFPLLFLAFLTSCGNPSSNSDNLNFPFGLAVCSYTCNVAPSTSPPTISKAFAAVTSYGTHQILIFYNPGSTTNPYGFNLNNTSLAPTTSLYNSLQGPDGLLISSQGFTTSNGFSCAAPVLYGADGIGNKIAIWCGYDPSNTNNPGPTITINSTSLVSPEGMALDWVDSSGTLLSPLAPILFVANPGASNILAFDLRQITGAGTSNISPSGGLLSGTSGGLPFGLPANNTSLNGPAFVAFSNSQNTLFVSNTGNSQVNIYGNGYCLGVNLEPQSTTGCASTSQNVPPTTWLSGSNTFLSNPVGLVYYQGSLYVADYTANAVLIWDNVISTASNVTPTRRIYGPNTTFAGVYAISIDDNPAAPPGNTFFLSQINIGNLLGYNNATTSSGNIAPTFNINVINPTLSNGFGSGGGTTGYPGFF